MAPRDLLVRSLYAILRTDNEVATHKNQLSRYSELIAASVPDTVESAE
jgi:hypothetical protein